MQELSVKYYGNEEKHGLVIQAISQDLKNILGMTTIIDCQNAKQRQKSNNTVDGKFHDDQQNISELTIVKKLWTLASWRQCWKSHNVFTLRLGSERDIGRHTNCVAAIHSPRQPFFNEPIQKRGEPQELFKFPVEKILQITIPINHSDFGQRNGSEDAFSELWSNKHYFGT